MNEANVAKPEVKGVGEIRYRCAACGELMPPDDAVIVADQSYHPDHQPEEPENGR